VFFLVTLFLAPLPAPAQAQLHPAFAAALVEQRPGPATSRIGALSDYLPSLAGTAMDSPVYHIDPAGYGVPAAALLPAILILGGTHANEPAGSIAASLFVSWAQPVSVRLIVIPRANASAAGWHDPDRPGPAGIFVQGASGDRRFRYGARLTDPADEHRPDPPSWAGLEGREARNLNRNYPGDPEGSLTSRAAFAITTLIGRENVRVAFDLHEAGPSSGLAWAIVARPESIGNAALGVLIAEEKGVQMILELSGEAHRGYSHREWGRAGSTAAYLIETLNQGQKDGGLPDFDHLRDPEAPLWKRVGIQIETVLAILKAHSDLQTPAGRAAIEGMPGLEELRLDFSRYF
jgi:hypothetical protein